MENFTIESRYLKVCNEFRAVIRCMKAVFCWPDYQKLIICLLIKRLGRAFASKHAAEPLKHAVEILKQSAKFLKHSVELLRIWEKPNSSTECLESSAACLCYNTIHVVPITHSIKQVLFLFIKWSFYYFFIGVASFSYIFSNFFNQ